MKDSDGGIKVPVIPQDWHWKLGNSEKCDGHELYRYDGDIRNYLFIFCTGHQQ